MASYDRDLPCYLEFLENTMFSLIIPLGCNMTTTRFVQKVLRPSRVSTDPIT